MRLHFSTVIPGLLCLGLLVVLNADGQAGKLDQVLLKNGDRISGTVAGTRSDVVILDTSAAGTLTLKRSEIKEVILAEAANPSVPLPRGEASGSVSPVMPAPASRSAAADRPQVTPCGSSKKPAVASWSVGLQGGTARVQLGTTNQEQFGGLLGFDLCEGGGRDHTDLFSTGSHTKTYESGSGSINTDVVTAELEQQHFIGNRGIAVFALAEEFTNNSLGIASQRSFGLGVLSPQFQNHLFFYDFAVDGRYLSEHRDHTSPALNLVGMRFKEQMHTRPGRTFTWDEQGWVLPVFNDAHALQAYVSMGPSIGLKPWLTLSLSEEENYVGNSPKPNRKNYSSTQLTLTFQRSGSSTR